MRVAIIGAGIAGLACALELEKLGITPDIYEQRYKAGDLAPFSAAMLDINLAPVDNQLKHLEKHYKLKLQPLNKIKKVVIHSPNNKILISGRLGVFVKMGQDSDSVQQQWISKLQTRVKFKQHVDYFKIRNKYDRIVLADGSLNIPIQLNIYEPTFKGWVRGAYLTGNFEPHKAEFWLDREFAREGFGCLTPFNNKSASLVLQVSGITRQELHDYWNTFINKIGFKTVSTGYFETEFQTGRLKKHVVDNTVIVGQAGGFVEAIWSQGIYSSAVSGIEAARCIVQKEDYEKRIKHLVKTNERIYNLRQRLNGLDNNGLDLLLKMFKIPGVKQLAAAGSCSGIKLISRLITGISGKEDRENVF